MSSSCVFDKCCGCIELKSGCFIIGYLQLVGEIIWAVILAIGIGTTSAATQSTDEKVRQTAVVLAVTCGIMLLLLIVGLAFTITLLVGLHKNKRGHLKAYLIFSVVFLVIGVVLFFAGFASSHIDVRHVVSQIISLLISLYFLLVIRSQYLQMDPSKGPAIYNTA